jgi:hypothetical protein
VVVNFPQLTLLLQRNVTRRLVHCRTAQVTGAWVVFLVVHTQVFTFNLRFTHKKTASLVLGHHGNRIEISY